MSLAIEPRQPHPLFALPAVIALGIVAALALFPDARLLGPAEMGPEKWTLLFLAVCFLVRPHSAVCAPPGRRPRRRDVGADNRLGDFISSGRARRAARGRRFRPQLVAHARRAAGDFLRDARRRLRRPPQRRSVGGSGRPGARVRRGLAGTWTPRRRNVLAAGPLLHNRRRRNARPDAAGNFTRANRWLRVRGSVRASSHGDARFARRFAKNNPILTFDRVGAPPIRAHCGASGGRIT